MTLPFQIAVYDANGLVKSTSSGGLTSPVGIADGGTGETTAAAAFDALAPAGTEGDVMTFTGGAWVSAAPVSVTEDYILIRDEKSQNTDGGDFDSGAWRTRDLNTKVVDTGNNASLSSNQITLAAGTYRCRITAPAWQVAEHQAVLYNVSDSAVTVIGTSERSATTAGTSNRSEVVGRFTIATSKVFEVRHQCTSTNKVDGFGYAANFTTEVYTIAEFWKEA